jgi:phospholipase A1/A2
MLTYSLLGAVFLPGISAASEALLPCASMLEDKARLSCYDALNAAPGPAVAALRPAASRPVSRSHLTRSWDLDDRDEDLLGAGQSPLRPHRVSYLIVRRSSAPNVNPSSPTQVPTAVPADMDFSEIKFQISQKAKILNPLRVDFLGFTGFRLWGAYTQQSNWQAFNTGNSSPFRETNYEPELILTASTGNANGLKLINLGYAHQSNGRDLPGSRSWNRVYLQGGWETERLSLLLRGWWRIPENAVEDDNPDIEDYMGRAEAVLRWAPLDGSQVVNLTLRNSRSSGSNRGFAQLDWAAPVTVNKSTKLHIQLTSGYGESLIDYNVNQTTLGLGVSFRDW